MSTISLVALRMLQRHGDQYANTPETAQFLDRTKWTSGRIRPKGLSMERRWSRSWLGTG